MKNDPVDPRIRLAISQWPDDAPRGAVTSFCTEHDISRKTFYQILKQARTEGQAAALEPRSRRPKTSPNATKDEVKDQAVALRKAMEDAGWDHGPISVHDQMKKLGMQAPSTAVLAKIFRDRGFVTPAPQKRPRSSYRSFRYPMPNACWQLDATEYVLEGGRKCVIFQLLDDHSRLAVASLVSWAESGPEAVKVFRKGIEARGIPQRLLTDNGEALNPIRRGVISELVAYANSLGIATITGKPYKPTTQGKNERFHSTLFKWLKKQPFAKDLAELQAQIDVFDQAYNTQRGHQSLEERRTPQEAWDAAVLAEPLEPGEWEKLSTAPGVGVGDDVLAVAPSQEQSVSPLEAGATPEPAKLKATLRADRMEPSGSALMRVDKNRCLRVAGVQLYLGKLLRSTMVKVLWDQTELMVISMDGELITQYDYPFPEGVTYLSLKHATAKFQNLPVRGVNATDVSIY
ncbi:DDE-type integrase/transposase/recombinase [Glutamicibacter sp. NPDC087344]|uniref:DDE-type integrase/transposase/recombinase n=1 Tax=Glutamicibacter sp. NPDC087344 TaxID=3363994 RepID=UPI003830B26E